MHTVLFDDGDYDRDSAWAPERGGSVEFVTLGTSAAEAALSAAQLLHTSVARLAAALQKGEGVPKEVKPGRKDAVAAELAVQLEALTATAGGGSGGRGGGGGLGGRGGGEGKGFTHLPTML